MDNSIVKDEELNRLSALFLATYKDILRDKGVNASGTLANTATYELKVEGENICLYFNLQEYWKYVEKGRNGGFRPPIDAIEKWIRIKPVVPRADSNGKVPSTRQLAFMISNKIGAHGTDGRHCLQYLIDDHQDIVEQMANRIADILDAKIVNLINTI